MRTVNNIVTRLSEAPRSSLRGTFLHDERGLARDYGTRNGARHQLAQVLADQAAPHAEVYQHPAQAARFDVQTGKAALTGQQLAPADLEWLRRLPDPAQITYDQAVELARFAKQVKPRTPDARLVAAVWEPVKARHDRAQAETELRNARATWPGIPAEARAALIEAIGDETTELSHGECAERARRLLNEVTATRDTLHAAQISRAEARLAEIAEQDRDRTAMGPARQTAPV